MADAIAAAHGISMEAVALAWLRHQRMVTSITLGVKTLSQLEATLAAARLAEACAPAPEYPGWMPANSSAARVALRETGELPAEPGAA